MGSGDVIARIVKKVRGPRPLVREFVSELLGMFVLISFGLGSSAMYVINPDYNSFLSVNIAWGFAVSFAVWTSYAISGGQLNPAITFTLAIIGKIPWYKVPIYWLAQYLGSFLGAGSVYMAYSDAINHFDGGIRSVTGPNATAGIFATYPQPYLTTMGGFSDQMVGTQLLMMGIMAVNDRSNAGVPHNFAPLFVGFVVMVIGMSFGMNSGYAINPARDFGPRLFTAVAGWGTEVFTAGNYWFWIPLVAPHIGAFFGAFTYLTMITANLPTADEKKLDSRFSKDAVLGVDDVKLKPFAAENGRPDND